MRMPSGVVDQVIYFVAVDATDFVTRETGLSSFTVYRSRNGGAATAFTTPTVTEVSAANMPGVYKLLLDEDMDIDSGDDSQEFCVHITHAGMAPVTRTFELYRPKATLGRTLAAGGTFGEVTLGADVFGNSVADVLGRLPTALVGGRIDATVDGTGMENGAVDAILDRAAGVEASRTLRQALRLILAAAANKLAGAATTTVTVRDTADTKDRITATVDASGNRTAVSHDVS